MCIGGGASAPPPPPMPEPPPPEPEAVGEGVKKARAQDKQKQAFLASQTKKSKDGQAGLLTPAASGAASPTLIGS